MKEAANINLSLTKLGLCIMRLTEGASHVPFKDSALTKFLQESLGGNSKTTLLCTSSKHKQNGEESISTLRFAQRAKAIKNKAVSNVQRSPKEMEMLINKLQAELKALKASTFQGGTPAEIKQELP